MDENTNLNEEMDTNIDKAMEIVVAKHYSNKNLKKDTFKIAGYSTILTLAVVGVFAIVKTAIKPTEPTEEV